MTASDVLDEPAKAAAAPLVQCPVLYSTATWLAYLIAQNYYDKIHYVWCTPWFDASVPNRDCAVPPSSSPIEIYRSLSHDSRRGDRHSSKINENRTGIIRGAAAKHAEGVITSEQQKEIVSIVTAAQCADFRPLLFVIPTKEVAAYVVNPPPEDKAHPLSEEYIIPRLPRSCFDVIELGGAA